MKDFCYFPHDSNARNDPRVLKLRRIATMEGVGVYWCILEIFRESENYMLEIELLEDVLV